MRDIGSRDRIAELLRGSARQLCSRPGRTRFSAWTPGTRPSRPSCGARPGSSRRELGPATVADLDDATRREAPGRRGARRGLARAARRRGRRRAARRRGRGRDRRRRARRRGGRRRVRGPGARRATSRAGPASSADDGAVVAFAPDAHRRRGRRPAPRRPTPIYAVDGGDDASTRRTCWSPRATATASRRCASTPRRGAGADLTARGARDPGRRAGARRSPTSAGSSPTTTSPSGPRSASRSRAPTSSASMRGVLDVTVAYAAERQQYGVPVGSFQAVQHLLAEARCLMEGSLSVALHASWAVDNLPPDDARAAGRVAKAYCARAARTVCETAIQVHGGIGNTWECIVHVYLRRALLSSQWFGDDGVQLARACSATRLGRRPMDFRDSPAEAEFRARLRGPGSPSNNPGLPASSTDDEYWARQAEWHTALYDAGFFGLSWPDALRRPRAARRCSTSSSTRSSPPPARRRARASATSCRASRTHGSDGDQGPLPARARSAGASAGARASASPTPAPTSRRCAPRATRDGDEYVIDGPQDLDELLRRRRLVPPARAHRPRRAEAQGPLRVRGADAPARHRAAAAADDQRHHERVRPGAVRRRARPGREHDRRARRGLARSR